jgi:hypothetical protein
MLGLAQTATISNSFFFIEGFQDTKFDSLTLTFGSWVGIPAVPFVTLYRGDIPAAQLAGQLIIFFWYPHMAFQTVLYSGHDPNLRSRIQN